MLYHSTRTKTAYTFQQCVLEGLSPDGGLFVPSSIPIISNEELVKLRDLPYNELAHYIFTLYIQDEIPSSTLKKLIDVSFSTFSTGKEVVTPTLKINEDIKVLELFHGPTFAFKDVALQFLGNVFDHFLSSSKENNKKTLNVLGATSGDTGSAAIYGLKSKPNINIFMLFPQGKVSSIQEAQMTTVKDNNVHCLSIEGTFDDCQGIVKKLFGDLEFKKKYNLGAINSINFCRILAQISYYFFSYFQHIKTSQSSTNLKSEEVTYSVPTGNFGDVLAGYYAKSMGLPLKLIVSTNENDILTRFFSINKYSLPEDKKVRETYSPAMDILVSSNFERLVYHLALNHYEDMEKAFEVVNINFNKFKESGEFSLPKEVFELTKDTFISYSVNDNETLKIIEKYHKDHKYLLDPHTAVGVKAAEVFKMENKNSGSIICLSTAHPSKFPIAIHRAILKTEFVKDANVDFDSIMYDGYLPKEFVAWSNPNVEKRVTELKGSDFNMVKQFIIEKIE